MTPKLDAYERQAIRDAVKEASERSKKHRERWSLPRSSWGNQAQLEYEAERDRMHATKIADDSADVFVEILIDALRRKGAFLIFLE